MIDKGYLMGYAIQNGKVVVNTGLFSEDFD